MTSTPSGSHAGNGKRSVKPGFSPGFLLFKRVAGNTRPRFEMCILVQ